MSQTTAPTTHRAAKVHACDWCREPINKGDTYTRWAAFDEGTAYSARVHPECYEAMRDFTKTDAYDPEYGVPLDGEQPRGRQPTP